jgi:hypothetical protein
MYLNLQLENDGHPRYFEISRRSRKIAGAEAFRNRPGCRIMENHA